MLQPRTIVVSLAIVFHLVLGPSLSLAAQDEEQDRFAAAEPSLSYESRYAGDFGLQVNGYLWAPLFNLDPDSGIRQTNLSAGGGADLAVAFYLTPKLGIGGFLDLAISSPANQANVRNYFLAILIGPRLSYDITIYTSCFQGHPLFSLPLGLGLAMSVTKYDEIVNVIPVLKLDAGIYVNPFREPEWAFGFSLHYWFATEFTRSELSRMANYLMIGIGFVFHAGL